MKLNKTEQRIMDQARGRGREWSLHIPDGYHRTNGHLRMTYEEWHKDGVKKVKGKRYQNAIDSLSKKGLIGFTYGWGQYNHWTGWSAGKGMCWDVRVKHFTVWDKKYQDKLESEGPRKPLGNLEIVYHPETKTFTATSMEG